MAKSDNIFLIGLMGVGKTTIGRKLAEKLGKTFLDCDREIEERTGVTIELIFEIEGEEGFRRRESAVLDELTARSNVVIATGGGAVLGPENREWLKERGTVVYLNAPVKILAGRTQADRKRPLLQTEDRLARLTELLREREPFYLEIADVIINTDDLPMRKVVDSICGSLESQ
ncbi:MAG: shikimate kinase AroK [Gammaproteobacteria bacterium]|jgi:shikimate kinase